MTTGWTQERTQLARDLWDGSDLSANQIAERIGGGITKGAVCGKARRSGWKVRTHERHGGRQRRLPLAPIAFAASDLANEPVIDQQPSFSWNARGHHLLRTTLAVVDFKPMRSFRKDARKFLRWRAAQANKSSSFHRPGEDNATGLRF